MKMRHVLQLALLKINLNKNSGSLVGFNLLLHLIYKTSPLPELFTERLGFLKSSMNSTLYSKDNVESD